MRYKMTMPTRLATNVVGFAMASACAIHLAPAVAQPANPSDEQIAEAQQAVGTAEGEISQLVALLSSSDSQIAELELQMGALREAVNKALVDLNDAQTKAEQARQGVNAARSELDGTQSEMDKAQSELNEIARTAYRQGSVSPGVRAASGTNATQDALDRQTYLRVNAEQRRQAIDELDKLRTEKANEESRLRETRNLAEEREKEAEAAKGAAEQAINENANQLAASQAQRDSLVAERAHAQAKLDAARGNVTTLNNQREEYQAYVKAEEERKKAEEAAARAEAERKAAEEEAKRKAEAEAQRIAEEKRIAAEAAKKAEELARETASQAAAELVAASQPDHTNVADPYNGSVPLAALQGPEGNSATDQRANSLLADLETVKLETTKTVTEAATSLLGNASRDQKVETVIARAMAQIGTPYAWGGGTATGPSRGIRDGGVADSYGDYNKIGFDCSGLVLYAFAGIGIDLPHYTGYQYQRGTKVSPQNMQRGDLIFWGPSAEHHVAIYLGNGQMIEAPQSGSTVQISPVRWSGMSPYAVRLI